MNFETALFQRVSMFQGISLWFFEDSIPPEQRGRVGMAHLSLVMGGWAKVGHAHPTHLRIFGTTPVGRGLGVAVTAFSGTARTSFNRWINNHAGPC